MGIGDIGLVDGGVMESTSAGGLGALGVASRGSAASQLGPEAGSATFQLVELGQVT